MEVPGKMDVTAISVNMECGPCSEDGKKTKASVFCKTCDESLCAECGQHHRKLKLTKDHVLEEIITKDAPTICSEHPDDAVKFYCNDHDTVGCGTCTTLNHRDCSIDYLPEKTENLEENSEFKEMWEGLEHMADRMAKLKTRITDLQEESEQLDKAAIEGIESFRKKMNACLDAKTNTIVQEARELKRDNDNCVRTLNEYKLQVEQQLEDARLGIETENQTDKMYVFMKRTLAQLKELEKECAIRTQAKVDRYIFKPSERLRTVLESAEPLGELRILCGDLDIAKTSPTMQFIYNVKHPREPTEPEITGIVELSDTKFLLTDQKNNSLKLVDRSSLCVTKVLRLTGPPANLAKLPGDKVAVTLPNKRTIKVVLTVNDLTPVHDISVRGTCYGICYFEGKILVSYLFPSKLELLDLDGNVLKEINPQLDGNLVLHNPNYVISQQTRQGTMIYVSDYKTNTITKLNTDGEVLSQVKEKTLNPRGLVAIDIGVIVVCSTSSDKLFVFHEENGHLSLLKKWTTVKNPRAVDFSSKDNRMYVASVCSEVTNHVHVYKLYDSE